MDIMHNSNYLELFSWRVDIEWSSTIFLSICNRNSGVSLSSISSDDIDWSTLRESLGLAYEDIPTPCSTDTQFLGFNIFRVSGILVLLSVSTYWCYTCLKSFHSSRFTRLRSCSQSSNSYVPTLEDIDSPSLPPSPTNGQFMATWSPMHLVNNLNLQTKYFGPSNPDQIDEDLTTTVLNDEIMRRERKTRKKYKNFSYHEGLKDLSSDSSSNSSAFSYSHLTNNNRFLRDFSFESLRLLSGTYRDDSMDSASSEISFDFVSNAENSENSTVARLDKLQEEIDQLKTNCLLMDEEFGIIKCNRNLPGLSNLMETKELQGISCTTEEIAKQQNARACFKGLYSLTTINCSISSEFPDSMTFHSNSIDEISPIKKKECCFNEEEQLPSLEWDEEEMTEFLEEEYKCSKKRNNISYSPKRSESCESALDMTHAWSMSSNMSISDIETPASNGNSFIEIKVENIGPRQSLSAFIQNHHNNYSEKTQTVIQAYEEILTSINCKYLRSVRTDNNSAIRGAIFQVLTQRIHLPSCKDILQKLFKAMDAGCQSLLNWRFPNQISHSKSNIRKMMEVCVQTLDKIEVMMASGLEDLIDREESLRNLFNLDPTLDVYIIEAVKLYITTEAFYQQLRNGQNENYSDKSLYIPVIEKDIVDNHLHHVIDMYSFNQMDLSQFGRALCVTLNVITPSAYGTDRFISIYPEADVSVCPWPQVYLLAEEENAYSILVNQ